MKPVLLKSPSKVSASELAKQIRLQQERILRSSR